MTAREYAWSVLRRTRQEDSYTGVLLRQKPAELSGKDWSLAVKIIYGTLAERRYVEYQWAPFKKGRLPGAVEDLIDLSVYQMIRLKRVPDYAVIDEAVSLAGTYARGNYAGLVNAVLRNFQRRGVAEVAGNPLQKLAVETSVPDWLLGLWKAHYGLSTAERLCRNTLQEKPCGYRVRRMEEKREILASLPGSREGKLCETALICPGSPMENPWVKKGSLAVQDEASQIPCIRGGIEPGMRVLEMCAAPGTKTLQMAEAMKGRGLLAALELYPARSRMVIDMVRREGLSGVQVKAMDARKAHEAYPEGSFDRVMLDAPCSGLGVLRDKPDRKWRISPGRIDEVVSVQKELLEEGVRMTRKGGILVYSTCTLNKKENERQTRSLLQGREDLQLMEERTVFPFEDDTDGFYYSVIRRSA